MFLPFATFFLACFFLSCYPVWFYEQLIIVYLFVECMYILFSWEKA